MYNCSIISKPAVSHQDKEEMNVIIMSDSHVYNVWTLKRQPLNFIQNTETGFILPYILLWVTN